METFSKLFGSLLAFVYHCFDRIVILGYMPLLTRRTRRRCPFAEFLHMLPR